MGGFALLEVTIAMVLVGVLTALSAFAYVSNQRRTEQRANATAIVQAASDLQKKFGTAGQYGAVTTAVAVLSRAIPEDLRVVGTTTAQNSYGGAITVTPVTLTSVNDGLALSWANVPEAQCLDLVQEAHRAARRVSVAGVVVKPTDALQPVLGTLSAQCVSAERVDIVFDIGRSPNT